MAAKYTLNDAGEIFNLVEEQDFFRLSVRRGVIEERHVEDFLDTTIEWLSSNPQKGILIDFKGVTSVCPEFTVHLVRHYEEIKERGLYVRFVNVDPKIEAFVDVSNITVVMNLSDLPPEKPVLEAKKVLEDLAQGLSNKELMEKHKLSVKGLASMFRKLWGKSLISRKTVADRMGIEKSAVTMVIEGEKSTRVKVKASDALNDIRDGVDDAGIMAKYRLSEKGLNSLMSKLVKKGLVTEGTIRRWRKRTTE